MDAPDMNVEGHVRLTTMFSTSMDHLVSRRGTYHSIRRYSQRYRVSAEGGKYYATWPLAPGLVGARGALAGEQGQSSTR